MAYSNTRKIVIIVVYVVTGSMTMGNDHAISCLETLSGVKLPSIMYCSRPYTVSSCLFFPCKNNDFPIIVPQPVSNQYSWNIYSGWWFGCHEFDFPINIGLLSSSQLTNSYVSGRGGPGPPTSTCIFYDFMCRWYGSCVWIGPSG